MKTARLWINGFCLSFLLTIAACSSPSTGSPTGTAGQGGSSSCPSGQDMCGSGCVDTSSDKDNCGGCFISCSGGQTCQNSTCGCAAGLLMCNNSCVPSDATNCGSCGNACTGGQLCSGTTCTATCAGTMCGTACCDNATQMCMNNACVAISTTGTGGMGGTTGAGGSASGVAGTTGTAGGSAGTSGSAGRGGTMGSAGTTGTGGRGGTTGTAGTGGSAPAMTLVTSASGSYWNTTGTLSVVTSGTATVTVNDTTTKKTFEGFGGAFNEMGWQYLSMLSQADRDKAMQALFGTDGAHFVIGRIPIGASDYAIQRYTLNETANDNAMSNFSISHDMAASTGVIPYVKAAQAINSNIRFWASPWTPPTWMKTASGTVSGIACTNMGNSAFNGGCMQDIAANLTGLGLYFVKFIQAYQAQGITIETIAPQNEPNYSQGYPSAIWSPALYTKFIPILGQALTTAGLSTKIMLGTMSNGDNGAQSKDLMVVQAAMADATAKGLFKSIGLQWGMLDLYKGTPSMFDMYNIPVWATEHKCGNYPWNPGGGLPAYKEPAPNDQAYGVESWGYIRDAIKAGVTAYNAWNMVLDTVGKGNDTVRQWSQDSLLVVNTSSKTLTMSPAYYVFRHCSQFLKPGAKVVTTGGSAE